MFFLVPQRFGALPSRQIDWTHYISRCNYHYHFHTSDIHDADRLPHNYLYWCMQVPLKSHLSYFQSYFYTTTQKTPQTSIPYYTISVFGLKHVHNSHRKKRIKLAEHNCSYSPPKVEKKKRHPPPNTQLYSQTSKRDNPQEQNKRNRIQNRNVINISST